MYLKSLLNFIKKTAILLSQLVFTVLVIMSGLGFIASLFNYGCYVTTDVKIKMLENDFNSVTAAIYTYMNKYHALPGDDNKASDRFSGLKSAQNGNGNGEIEGRFDATARESESRLFWLHLRRAGLIRDDANDADQQPTHAFGGITGITGHSPYESSGLFIVFSAVPGKKAIEIEERADDQLMQFGAIQAQERSESAAIFPEGYSKDAQYDVYFKL